MKAALQLAKSTGAAFFNRVKTKSKSFKRLCNGKKSIIVTGSVVDAQSHIDSAVNESASRLIRPQDGEEDSIAVMLNSELLSDIKTALLEHRKMTKAEDSFDNKIKEWKPEHDLLEQQIARLENQISEAGDDESAEVQNNPMRNELSSLRQRKQRIVQQRDACREELLTQYEDLRHGQFFLFEKLDNLFAEHLGMLPDEAVSVNAQRTASVAESQEGLVAQDIREGSPEQGAQEEVPEEVRDMLRLIECTREYLEQARYSLNHRHEKFERQILNRQRMIEHGGQHGSLSELEISQFRETQELTRAVVRAEAQYQEAKQQAIDRGLQPEDSDIESGFVDDSDDGYRESLELAVIQATDHGVVHRWLDATAEDHQSVQHPYDLRPTQVEFPMPEISDGLIEWNAEEVEIWESASMVAEGRYRRRIDRWQELLNASQSRPRDDVSRVMKAPRCEGVTLTPSSSWGRDLAATIEDLDGER